MFEPDKNPSHFYRYFYRNLNVLRDIQRLFLDARNKSKHSIVFRDEKGEVWQLKHIPTHRVGEIELPDRHSLPITRAVSTPVTS